MEFTWGPFIVSIIANVSSGIVGAIIGALVVWFVSYRERLHAARSRLTHHLLRNGHTIWYGQGNSQAWQVIDSNYAEIQAEYLALRRLIFCTTKRLNLENAWIEYTGVGHYRDIPDGDPAKIFAKSAVSREQAIQRIIGLLKAIE